MKSSGPCLAIVGLPNVGKSTFFNQLIGERSAVVHDQPGVTIDRHYGYFCYQKQPFVVIDTGGYEHHHEQMTSKINEQTLLAIEEADIIIWLVDIEHQANAHEKIFAQEIRKAMQDKPVILITNKMDKQTPDAMVEYYQFGFEHVLAVSAKFGHGMQKVREQLLSLTQTNPPEEAPSLTERAKIAIVGKPNVGKSTLTNTLLQRQQVVTHNHPGTTRDSINIPFDWKGQAFELIDTAGLRRKTKIDPRSIERFSVIRTFQSIHQADIICYLVDATDLTVSDQDVSLLSYVQKNGKPIIPVLNKCDRLSPEEKKEILKTLRQRLPFLYHTPMLTISAKKREGIQVLMKTIQSGLQELTLKFSTAQLNKILEEATYHHPPPIHGIFRIKLNYVHVIENQPLTLAIHGKQLSKLPKSYLRYLEKFFIDRCQIRFMPLFLKLITDRNPYVKN